MKVTFFLNTSQERFCGWLYHHLEEDSNEGKLDFAAKEAGLALEPSTDVVPLPSTRIVLRATPIPPPGETPDLLELVSSMRTVIYFWVHPLTAGRVEVTAECNEPVVMEYFEELLSQIEERWPGSILERGPKDTGMPRGPTLRTRIRAKVFRRLKEEHPEWSQAKVAMEAMEELGEEVTADTVRNTYRAMGWTWERGDRTR